MQKVLEEAAAQPCYGTPYRYLIRLHLHAFVEELLRKPPKELLILDVGCGKGAYSRVFSNFQTLGKYVGGDIEAFRDSWKQAKRRFEGKFSADYICFDANHLPLKDDAFDAVLCIAALEHIKDDESAVEEIERVLRKEGVAYVWVPSKGTWLFDLGKHGYHFYSLKDIVKLFEGRRLTISKVMPTGGTLCFITTCLTIWLKLVISAIALALGISKDRRKYLADGVDRLRIKLEEAYNKALKYCVRKDFAAGNKLPGGYSIIIYKRFPSREMV